MCPPEQVQQEKKGVKMVQIWGKMEEVPFFERYYDVTTRKNEVSGTTEIRNFEHLNKHLQRLPAENAAGGGANANNENVGYKERRRRENEIKQKKEEYKEFSKNRAQQGLLDMKDITDLSLFENAYGLEAWKKEKLPHSHLTREQTMKNILENNDYSNFENLDDVMRNVVASSALSKFITKYKVTKNSDPKKICKKIIEKEDRGFGVGGLLNPGLRLGLSLAQKTEGIEEEWKSFFRRMDEEMSTQVMVATIINPPIEMNLKKYFSEKGEPDPDTKAKEAIKANKAQQIQIAKRLLLMQLSDFKKIEVENNEEKVTDWDKSMAVALSHCSRVVVTLPNRDKALNTKANHDAMWRSILTIKGENAAQDNRRGGSTHSVKRRKISNKDFGSGTVAVSKEKKVLVNLVGQRGMNCAIGGLGYEGISKQILCNDGSSGHFYSMYKEADATHNATFLMGLESDANGVMNQMGHTHDIHATPEKASSLGGQRVDEVGKKYGGRQCDLSRFTAREITDRMQQLEIYMEEMQSKGLFEYEKYQSAMSMLAGKKMNRGEQMKFFEMTGIPLWGSYNYY